MSQLTLMPIFAHPDDESFAGTGALIRYAREGVHVALVSATRGERGKVGDPPVCRPEEIAAVREAELRAACQVLGIADLRLLDYQDKELPDADETEAVGRLVACIREIKPQVIYTFPPDGHSGHADHIAINRWVSLAFRAAGDPERYPEAGPAWQPTHLYWHLRPENSERVDVVMNSVDTLATRVAALKCHRTQHLSIERVFRQFDPAYLRERWGQDRFHLVDTTFGERPKAPWSDLFEGVR